MGALCYWRAVVAACLALPALPLLMHPAAAVGVAALGTSGVATASAATIAPLTASAPWLPQLILAAVGAGILLRAAWLAAGLLRLRRTRRNARSIDGADFEDLRGAIAPRARFEWLAELAQPATFGLRHPVILLPLSLRDLPLDAQRAVVAHELVHVARRDWLWVPIEEAVRTVFWFHPFVAWALSQVQLGREQVVDAAVVALTRTRGAYLEALLRFADPRPSPSPAMAFIRRRHLAARMRALVKEETMSLRRAAVIAALSVVLVAAAGWTLSQALPLPMLAAQGSAPSVNQVGPVKYATTILNAAYPDEARNLGILADVSVGVTVAPSGEVVESKVVSWGYHVTGDDSQARDAFLAAEPVNKRFAAAAERAARAWRFETGGTQWTTGIRFEFRELAGRQEVTVSSPNAVAPASQVQREPLRVGGSIKPPRVITRTKPILHEGSPRGARRGRCHPRGPDRSGGPSGGREGAAIDSAARSGRHRHRPPMDVRAHAHERGTRRVVDGGDDQLHAVLSIESFGDFPDASTRPLT